MNQDTEKLVNELQIFIPRDPSWKVVIEADHIRKAYGDRLLVDDMNFKLPAGGIVGIIGPNGAGKSTLMRTIATLQEADNGAIDFNGINVLTQKQDVRKILGYLPQQFGVYPKISAQNSSRPFCST